MLLGDQVLQFEMLRACEVMFCPAGTVWAPDLTSENVAHTIASSWPTDMVTHRTACSPHAGSILTGQVVFEDVQQGIVFGCALFPPKSLHSNTVVTDNT